MPALAAPAARTTPPDLSDKSKYTKLENVPILDVHFRRLVDPDTREIRSTVVDENQLRVIARNSEERARRGEKPRVFIGHTDHKRPEHKQPPLTGYLENFQVGSYNGRPTILADMYVKNVVKIPVESDDGSTKFITLDREHILENFPSRSAEVYRKMEPDGFIGGLALLKQLPERDLGYVTYSRNEDFEIFECSCEKDKGDCMCDDPTPVGGAPANGEPMSSASETPEPDMGDPGDREQAAVDKIAASICKNMSKDKGLMAAIAAEIAPVLAQQIGNLLEERAVDDAPGQTVNGTPAGTDVNPKESLSAATPAVGMPSGTNTYVPSPDAGEDEVENMSASVKPETDVTTQLVVLAVSNDNLKAENKALRDELADLRGRMEAFQATAVKATRKSELTSLVNRLKLADVDIDGTVEKFAARDAADWTDRLTEMEKFWRRSPETAPELEIAPNRRAENYAKGDAPAMSEDDAIMEKGVEDGSWEQFRRDNAEMFQRRPGEDAIACAARGMRSYIAAVKAKK